MRPPNFWSSAASIRSDLLSPLAALYGCATATRARRPATWTAPVPVICVGNVVLGGAGKTPVSQSIAARFRTDGRTPHILSRGYGGRIRTTTAVNPSSHTAADVGDEPLLSARYTPTWVGANRIASAKCAIDAGADVLIMDDGFQNAHLAKTRSLLVFDAGFGIGNGRVFPAGPLREPLPGALARADALVYIGNKEPTPPEAWTGPVFRAKVEVDSRAREYLSGRRLVAFAGIGRPEKFFDTLRAQDAELIRTIPFADHHAYRRDEITGLIAAAKQSNADLMTTEKDHVRIPNDLAKAVMKLPITLDWDDGSALDAFLADALKAA